MTVVWQTANTLTVTYFNFNATTLYYMQYMYWGDRGQHIIY